MADLDIDSLLQPVSDDNPSGENLEYDAAFQELERIAVGKPGSYDPVSGETVGAEEPDWRQVRDLALALFGRTHDLRVAYYLAVAQLRLDGWAGFAAGLQLMLAMLERYWTSLHPDLIEDEGNDPIERLNVLANLSDAERFLPVLRSTPIVAAQGVGRFSLRDLDVAQGRVEAREGEEVASLSLLSGAWQAGDPDENESRRAGVVGALAALDAIEAIFRDQSGYAPDFSELSRQLKSISAFYAELTGGGAEAGEGYEAGGAEAAGAATGIAAAPGAGGLASRADAVRVLRQVSDFLKRAEPSSPAPMFIDRAVKLLEMSFADIVLELMPDSRERIELLGGIKFEDSGY